MWSFEGNGRQIGFSVSRDGVLSAYGRATQHCSPQGGNFDVIARVADVSAEWRICTPASAETEYDGMG
jgi:hypothetical protein